MEKHNDTGGQPQSHGATTAASTEAHTGKRPKREHKGETGNPISLSDEEFAAKAKEFEQIQQDYVVQAGMLLDEVRKRTNRGRWGQFCREAGITRRSANQYIFVARSPLAQKLQGLGIAKALLLARHETARPRDRESTTARPP